MSSKISLLLMAESSLIPVPSPFFSCSAATTISHLPLLFVPVPHTPLVLGLPWLATHNPHIDWSTPFIINWSLFFYFHCLRSAAHSSPTLNPSPLSWWTYCLYPLNIITFLIFFSLKTLPFPFRLTVLMTAALISSPGRLCDPASCPLSPTSPSPVMLNMMPSQTTPLQRPSYHHPLWSRQGITLPQHTVPGIASSSPSLS